MKLVHCTKSATPKTWSPEDESQVFYHKAVGIHSTKFSTLEEVVA